MHLHLYIPTDHSKGDTVIVSEASAPTRRGHEEVVLMLDGRPTADDVYRLLGGTSAKLADVERALRGTMAVSAYLGIKGLSLSDGMPFAWFDEAQDDLEGIPLPRREGLRRDHLRQYFRILVLLRSAGARVEPLRMMRQAVRFSQAHPTSTREKQRRRRRTLALV